MTNYNLIKIYLSVQNFASRVIL